MTQNQCDDSLITPNEMLIKMFLPQSLSERYFWELLYMISVELFYSLIESLHGSDKIEFFSISGNIHPLLLDSTSSEIIPARRPRVLCFAMPPSLQLFYKSFCIPRGFTVISAWAYGHHILPSIPLTKAAFLTWKKLPIMRSTCPMTACIYQKLHAGFAITVGSELKII